MKNIFAIFIFLEYAITSFSQDRVFAYTYQTNILPRGSFDIEFQNTLSVGKVGAYSPYVFGQHLDQRLELEVGLGKKVQTSFYLNSELFNYADTTSTDLNQELHISFSNEWKWKLTDPVANKIGSALYGELEFGGNNIEFEGKIILDRQVSKNLFAFNLVGKYEIERFISRDANNVIKAAWTHNSLVELYFGYMRLFKPEISLGLEMRNNNDITKEDGWMNSVLFMGPAFHASIESFSVNISALLQLANLKKTDVAPGNKDLNDFEAAEFRALIGYSF